MRKLYILSLIVCLFFLQTSKIYAQNVGIGTTTPRPFALLEIKSQNSGLLIPRVNTANPVFLGLGALDHGLIVYDTILSQLQVWDGGAWQTASSAWSVNGSNVFYNAGNVGIGTNTPSQALDLAGGNINIDLTHAYLQGGTHLLSFSPLNNNIRIGANAAPSITTGNEIIAIGNNAGVALLLNYENERMFIGTNANIGQLLLDPSGNVGIAQPTPLYRMDVLGAIRSGGNGLDGQMRIFSEQGVTDYEVIFNPNPAMTATTTYTLPADDGTASDVLTTDGAGGLSWASGTGFSVAGNGLNSSGNTVNLGGTVNLTETFFDGPNDMLFRMASSNSALNTKVGMKFLMFDGLISDQWEVIARKSDATVNSGQSNFVINKQFSTAGGQLDAITIDGNNSNVIINNAKTTASAYGDFLVLNGEVGIGTNAPGTNKLSVVTQSSSGAAGYFENNIAGGIDGSALRVLNSGTRSIGHNGMLVQNLVTKVGGSNSTKIGLKIESTGAWGVATVNQPNVGLDVTVSGADDNYAAIFNGGNVGIGTSSPAYRLDINGGLGIRVRTQTGGENFVTFVNSNDGNVAWGINDGWTVNRDFRLYRYNSLGTFLDQPLTVQNTTGNVGINIINPTFKLHVNGSVAGVGAYNNLSDKRFKKNVEMISEPLKKVMALEGISFEWDKTLNPELEIDEKRHLGFLAQDVEKILPNVVNTADDSLSTKTVEYASIVPVLVEAIKEQQHIIEELEAKNSELSQSSNITNKRLNELQAQIDNLTLILTSEAKK